MSVTFNKRIYSVPAFSTAVGDVIDHIGDLRAASHGGRIDRAFAERIMLAVTAVNGCRYCHYGHTRSALKSGVTEEEIRHITELEFGQLPQRETVALLFAQHYADTEGNPDPEAWQQVLDVYGPDTARDIMAYIRMIMVGNLLGNTLDALLSRLKGRPAARSSLWQELGVLLGGPLIILAALVRHLLKHLS